MHHAARAWRREGRHHHERRQTRLPFRAQSVARAGLCRRRLFAGEAAGRHRRSGIQVLLRLAERPQAGRGGPDRGRVRADAQRTPDAGCASAAGRSVRVRRRRRVAPDGAVRGDIEPQLRGQAAANEESAIPGSMEGNVIELISPVGYPRVEEQAPRKTLGTPVGRRLGFIWNQYQTTRNFWPRLERAVEEVCRPSAVTRAYKANTW